MKTLKIRKQLPNCEVLKIVAFFDNCNVLHYSFYKVKIFNFQPSEKHMKISPTKTVPVNIAHGELHASLSYTLTT